MRGFLGWLVLVAILATIAFLGAPVVARPLIADAVRGLSPFGSAPLEVDVDVDSMGLLGGKVDRIHVTGSALTSDRLEAEQLSVTLFDVDILDRSFDRIDGGLLDVVLHRMDGTEIRAARLQLTGASDAVEVQTVIDREPALLLIRDALQAAGLPIDGLTLLDGGIRLSILGVQTDVALGLVDGAAVLSGQTAAGDQIKVFGPEDGDAWRISGIMATRDGLDVSLDVDLGELLSPR